MRPAYRIDPALLVNIKDTTYSVASLLRSKKLAARYTGGTLLVLRLTVGDYHRYHYPVSGIQSKNHFIPGILHTVNPIANDYIPIYKENSREYTVIRSPEFGDVTQMEVGAMLVGKMQPSPVLPCFPRRRKRVFSIRRFDDRSLFSKRMLSHSVRILRKTPDKGMKPSFTLGAP